MMDAAGRLCADPCISVMDIAKAIKLGCEVAGEKHLYDLLSSPSKAALTWKANPSPEWLHKVSPLFVHLGEICPNTVLLSSKVVQAVQNLQNENVIVNNTGKLDVEFLDKCDLAIRILFCMFRELKRSLTSQKKLMSKCSTKQWTSIEFVLNKLKVPPLGVCDVIAPDVSAPVVNAPDVRHAFSIFRKVLDQDGAEAAPANANELV